MDIEDEARQMLARQRQLDTQEAAREAREQTAVVTDWALDLARHIEQAGYEPLPMYKQQGAPHKTSRYAISSVTTVRSLGLSGWNLQSGWDEAGAEYRRSESATLTTDGQLWMGSGRHDVASGLTEYRGILTGVTKFLIVAGNPLISEGHTQHADKYRKVFGVFGVAALLSGCVKSYDKSSLAWTGLY